MMKTSKKALNHIVNVICITRLIFAATYIYALTVFGSTMKAFLIAPVVLIVLSDIFDGVLARKWGVDTAERRFIDNVLDKIVINLVFIATVVYFNLSWWIYFPLFIRDLSVSIGGICLAKRNKIVIFPNRYHKLAILSIAVAGCSYLLDIPNVLTILLPIVYVLNYLTMFDYALILLKQRERAEVNSLVDAAGYYPQRLEGLEYFISLFGQIKNTVTSHESRL